MSSRMSNNHAENAATPELDSRVHTHVGDAVIKRALTRTSIHTSTPKTMDGFNDQTYLQALDNDSGYVSHNHESNLENFQENVIMENPIFVSEDTLLEEPKIQNNPAATESMYEDFTNVYYLNSLLDSSAVTVQMSYSGLQDSSALSTNLSISPELKLLEPIVTTKEQLNLFPVNHHETGFLIDNDSNCENDPNLPNKNILLNASNAMQDFSNTNILNKSSAPQSIPEFLSAPQDVISTSNCNVTNKTKDVLHFSNSNPQDVSKSYSENLTNFSNKLNILQDSSFKVLNNSNVSRDKNQIATFNTSNIVNKILQSSNKVNIVNNSVANKSSRPVHKRKRSLSKTPQKRIKSFNSDLSPDLFSDDEAPVELVGKEVAAPLGERYILESDKCLLKRVGESLSGVLPPPSVTSFELSVGEMLEKIKVNSVYFWDKEMEDNTKKSSLLVNTDLQGCLSYKWPNKLEDRYHGLHYNRSKLSEELESLCSKYSQRYVGSETQSSCTVFDVRMSSPSKRKSNRLRWAVKSPGRRLSHLARRRITFSSANLQAGGSSGSCSRQVMMDARRYDLLTRKSPRKNKSPRKSPRKAIRTPNSTSKKRLFHVSHDESKPEPSSTIIRASATKRALFQSPDKKMACFKSRNIPSTSNPTTSPWKKKMTPKRALFCSPSKISPTNKRKRQDNDDFMPTKIARSLSLQNESSTNPTSVGVARLKVSRSESTINCNPVVELSANHKKKLQWAVYEALRSQNIGVSHPQFKQFATVLARVTRKLLPNPASAFKTEGTSERMLRVAKQHVFSATKGKSVDEIIQAYEASRAKVIKPSGYISKEAAGGQMDVSIARSRDSGFQDKANTLNRESSNDVQAIKTNRQIGRPENKIERVKKIINFDDDGSRYSFK